MELYKWSKKKFVSYSYSATRKLHFLPKKKFLKQSLRFELISNLSLAHPKPKNGNKPNLLSIFTRYIPSHMSTKFWIFLIVIFSASVLYGQKDSLIKKSELVYKNVDEKKPLKRLTFSTPIILCGYC
ncbi:MAG: hypothetical protein K0R26_2526 [Bacteroidota bacterium]|jgi:hypothetical protein|nr:hypothetical protein [Bacteroidota bacterium]